VQFSTIVVLVPSHGGKPLFGQVLVFILVRVPHVPEQADQSLQAFHVPAKMGIGIIMTQLKLAHYR